MEDLSTKQWVYSEPTQRIRLDKFLSEMDELPSRTKLQEWIKNQVFTLNGKPCKKNVFLNFQDVIQQVKVPTKPQEGLEPQNLPLNIVYEDNSLMVLNKPSGMVVHPGSGIFQDTLANALAFHYKKLSDVNGPLRPGILHRLDKDTSGLLVIAKNNKAHTFLAEQLKDHSMTRHYYGLIWRHPKDSAGKIDKPLARQANFRIRRSVSPDGQKAITHYKVLEYFNFCSFLKLKLETGRTHQIRVHLSSVGHPVMGDPLYGGNPYPIKQLDGKFHTTATQLLKILKTQALHAGELHFIHPDSKKAMGFECPLPSEMSEALKLLRRDLTPPENR